MYFSLSFAYNEGYISTFIAAERFPIFNQCLVFVLIKVLNNLQQVSRSSFNQSSIEFTNNANATSEFIQPFLLCLPTLISRKKYAVFYIDVSHKLLTCLPCSFTFLVFYLIWYAYRKDEDLGFSTPHFEITLVKHFFDKVSRSFRKWKSRLRHVQAQFFETN